MPLDFADQLRRDGGLFRAAVQAADPTRSVPTCPDWTADDLLWHLGGVFWFWGMVVRLRATDGEAVDVPDPPRPADRPGLLDFYDTNLDGLLDTIENTAGDVPVWTWAADPGDHRAGFVRRRMAHEALIHRIDAELTAGDVSPVDPALATDGVAEALQHFRGYVPPAARFRADGPLARLRAADTGTDWLVQVGSFAGYDPRDDRTHDAAAALRLLPDGQPLVTVTAPARDLDAWLWNRPTLEDLVVDGDPGGYDRLAAVIARPLD